MNKIIIILAIVLSGLIGYSGGLYSANQTINQYKVVQSNLDKIKSDCSNIQKRSYVSEDRSEFYIKPKGVK